MTSQAFIASLGYKVRTNSESVAATLHRTLLAIIKGKPKQIDVMRCQEVSLARVAARGNVTASLLAHCRGRSEEQSSRVDLAPATMAHRHLLSLN